MNEFTGDTGTELKRGCGVPSGVWAVWGHGELWRKPGKLWCCGHVAGVIVSVAFEAVGEVSQPGGAEWLSVAEARPVGLGGTTGCSGELSRFRERPAGERSPDREKSVIPWNLGPAFGELSPRCYFSLSRGTEACRGSLALLAAVATRASGLLALL